MEASVRWGSAVRAGAPLCELGRGSRRRGTLESRACAARQVHSPVHSFVSILLFYTVTEHSVMASARGCPGSTCISPVWQERCKLSLSLSLSPLSPCHYHFVFAFSFWIRCSMSVASVTDGGCWPGLGSVLGLEIVHASDAGFLTATDTLFWDLPGEREREKYYTYPAPRGMSCQHPNQPCAARKAQYTVSLFIFLSPSPAGDGCPCRRVVAGIGQGKTGNDTKDRYHIPGMTPDSRERERESVCVCVPL